jgi:hypothetical protein
VALFRLVDKRATSDLRVALGPAAALNLWLLLFATVGGAGSIFNLLISPAIRAYNRVLPFIGFLSLYAICWLLTGAQSKLARRKLDFWFIFGFVGIVAIGVVDEAPFNHVAQIWKADRDVYKNTHTFISELEQKLPAGALIFQLPDGPYPNAPKLFDMESQQNLGSYVVSRSARFSWPALSGQAMRFHQGLSSIGDPARLAEMLSIVGFDGMLLDRWGLDERGASLIRRLGEFGVKSELESIDGRFSYLSLERVKQRLALTEDTNDLARQRGELLFPTITVPIEPLPETGFLARISVEDAPIKTSPGEMIYLRVKVKNESSSVWRVGGKGRNTIKLSFRWVGPANMDPPFQSRISLFQDVDSGAAVGVSLVMKAPPISGRYSVEFDLVQEHVAWFSDKGSSRARWDVVVVGGEPAAK